LCQIATVIKYKLAVHQSSILKMSQTISPSVTNKLLPKLPLEVDLAGYVRDLVDAKFENCRMEMEKMNKINEQQNALLQKIDANTKYPLKPYTEDDFTAMFGVQKRTQLNYRKAKKLRFHKIGGKVCYTKEQIQEFIQLHEVTNTKQFD